MLDRIPDHWGKSLPDPGWDDLLLDLNERLAKLDPGYQIRQVKEKFGLPSPTGSTAWKRTTSGTPATG